MSTSSSEPTWTTEKQSAWAGYLVTLVLEAGLTAGLLILKPHLPLYRFPIPYVLLIMLVAYVFGEGPAIMAFVIGFLVFDYFFVPPLGTVFPHSETPMGWAALIAFMMGTLIVGFATILMRRSRRHIERVADSLRDSESLSRDLIVSLKQADEERKATIELLGIAYETMQTRDLIRSAADFFLRQSGCNAVGISVKDGDDYAHYEATNLREESGEADRQIRESDAEARHVPCFTAEGIIERVCEDVVERRVDPSKPFYTAHGSFWVNSSAELLSALSDADQQAGSRDRREGEGYESLALIPLHAGEDRLGLLRLSDRHKDALSLELVESWEDLADYLAVALVKVRAEEALQRRTEELQAVMDALPVGVALTDKEGGVIQVNDIYNKVWGGPRPRTATVEDYAAYRAWWADTGEPVAPEEWASAQAVQKGEAVVGQLLEIQRFDGSRAFIINSGSPVRDANGDIIGSAVAVQDITSLRMAEKALIESEEHKLDFFRRTLKAATGGKLVVTERTSIEEMAGPALATWEIHELMDLKAIRDGVGRLSAEAGMDRDWTSKFQLCVGEAATNAIKHAGGGTASVHRINGRLACMVSDHGPGMEDMALPEVALTPGYSTAGTLGMGYKVMLSFAEKVYLATGPEGTIVLIETSLHPSQSAPFALESTTGNPQ